MLLQYSIFDLTAFELVGSLAATLVVWVLMMVVLYRCGVFETFEECAQRIEREKKEKERWGR